LATGILFNKKLQIAHLETFSISLRAWDTSWAIKAKSLYNLTVQRKFDNMMKARFKKDYMDWKENLAIKRANNALVAGRP
jgi:hypothetical protein